MILIYRKTDGVIVGEHPDDAKAERLANEYGSAFGVRVLPYPENRSWLEKAVQYQIKARIWREWKDSLWMNGNKETLRQAESPGSGWTLVDPSGLHGEHIGDTAPGSAWQMTQDVEFADDTERAGKLSIDPTTGAVLMDGLPASVVMTVAATDMETAAAIRSKYSINEELKIVRLARANSQDLAVQDFDSVVAAEVEKGKKKKAKL